MLEREWLMALVLGGIFLLLGIASILWGKGEEKSYFNKIATRPDAREFLEHWPHRPQPEALKIGGWIAIAVGLLMVVIGGWLWLWG